VQLGYSFAGICRGLAARFAAGQPSLGGGPAVQGGAMSNEFFPRGAIASFLVLVALYGVIWGALYFVTLSRG